MKKIAVLLLALACVLTLAACGCEHEWLDATCDTPKTCSLCKKQEGTALGHEWLAATCDAPKTCIKCSTTVGEANGHTWVEATCEAPKNCSVCHKQEGVALGHEWLNATTSAPKTCDRCAATEGERIVTDARFTTEACKDYFGTWKATIELPYTELDPSFAGVEGVMPMILAITLNEDGTGSMKQSLEDTDSVMAVIHDFTVQEVIASTGMGKEALDEAFQAEYGMTLDAYVDAIYAELDLNELFAAYDMDTVYYVKGDTFYMGTSWDDVDDDPTPCKRSGDTMKLTITGLGEYDFTRAQG